MNDKIFKYELEITDFQDISMPIGAKIISSKEQNGKLCIWALVDLVCGNKDKTIRIVGTGQDIEFNIGDYSFYFVETVIMSNGMVLHVFAYRQ